jgi:hypothetical protein
VTAKSGSRWTIIPTDRFTHQMAQGFAALDGWVRKNQSLKSRERYLKEISRLKAFKKFTLYDAAMGPDRSFTEIPQHGSIPSFQVRQMGPWTGYCTIDKDKKTIRWDFATYQGIPG